MNDKLELKQVAEALAQAALDNCRAFDDMQQANTYLRTMLDQWDALPEVARNALFQSAVIVYCRPFVSVRAARTYSLKSLKTEAAFDRDVHEHLLALRNRFLAHSDRETYKPRLGFATMTVRLDDGDQFQLPFSVSSYVYAWEGSDDRHWIDRVSKHVEAVCTVTSSLTDNRLREIIEMAIHNGVDLWDAKGHVPLWGSEEVQSGKTNVISQNVMHSHAVKGPDIGIGGPAYQYRMTGRTVTANIVLARENGEHLLSVGTADPNAQQGD